MKVGHARTIAKSWVKQVASHQKGFLGAYFTGSIIYLSDNDVLPETSDVDVMIVTKHEDSGPKLGKFIYSNVLLEVTHISWSQLASARKILISYHLAGSFQHNTIIADPTGELSNIQTAVSQQFKKSKWVRVRYKAAIEKVKRGLQALDDTGPLHDQVMWWLFPTGVTTHALLVAALKNPTIRLRYLAARDVLRTYGYEETYSRLLELLGCQHMTSRRVSNHLNALEDIFDQSVLVSQTPFFFSSDISRDTRHIAIDGSRKLIQSGNYKEAVFWIIATFSRCYAILKVDGSIEVLRLCVSAFDAILDDMGIYNTSDLIRHSQQTIQFLPELESISEKIMLAHPEVTCK